MKKENSNTDKEHEIEKCVYCHANTKYTKDVSIEQRKYYIRGCGQLCEKCYRYLYPEGNE